MDAGFGFPVPDPAYEPLRPFWSAAAEKRLSFPQCANCGRFNWYPQPTCAGCEGSRFTWTNVDGPAHIFTYTVVRRALHRPLQLIVPYTLTILEFAQAPGIRFVTRWLGPDPDRLFIGKAVRIVYEDIGYPACETGILAPFAAQPRQTSCFPTSQAALKG